MKYTQHYNKKSTPQTQPIPGKNMVKMRSGGYGFKIGDWEQLRRFLILGTEGGTYYASEKEMTLENAQVVERCLNEDYIQTINEIAHVSDQGLALKNDAALFALAIAASHETEEIRQHALSYLSIVARTGSHLFMFLEMSKALRGWGRSFKRAVADWYNTKDVDRLAYQVIKYRNRYGWTHRDVLRKAHPVTHDNYRNELYKWITQGTVPEVTPEILQGYLNVQSAENAQYAANIVYDFRLPREAIPTEYLNDPLVWEAMLKAGMPITALVRNLGVMTANGTLREFSDNAKIVINLLRNSDAIQRSRIHPIQILFALKTYTSGQGFRGSKSWTPLQSIADALDDAYYLAFDNVQASDKNIVLGIDVSGSMGWHEGILSCSEYAAAMAMVTAKFSPNVVIKAFAGELRDLQISPKMRLDDIVRKTSNMTFGSTDPALVIKWATNNRIPVDVFGFYSDGEAWSGDQHVMQALETYRRVMNRPNTKLYCANFVPSHYGFVDADDPLCLNLVGNSPDIAQAISAFVES